MPKWIGMVSLLAATAGLRPTTAEPLRVAVTLSDVLPIVQAVGGDQVRAQCVSPSGGDPHSFTLSVDAEQALRRADLVVYTSSQFLEFERAIKRSHPDRPAVDWPDYMAQGARLHDVPGLPQNPHGLWTDLDNGLAIARAVAARLRELGARPEVVSNNLERFEAELRAAQTTGRALAQFYGVSGSTLVAVVPGVADCILNLGMKVGKVLLPTEGSSFASARDVEETVSKLRSGEWAALVVPLGMEQAKPGEIARQVARDSGARVIYVRFLSPLTDGGTYLSQAYYNAAVLTAGARSQRDTGAVRNDRHFPSGGYVDHRGVGEGGTAGGSDARSAPCSDGVSARTVGLAIGVPALILILGLLVALRRAWQAARTAFPGAGIFGDQ